MAALQSQGSSPTRPFEPGFIFGFTDHTLRVDNVTLRGGFFDGRFESGDFSGWNPTP